MSKRGATVVIAVAGLALGSMGMASSVAQPSAETATSAPDRAATATSRTTDVGAGVVVKDITIRVPHQDPVQAFLVRPRGHAGKHSQAGILWLHWLGQFHNDRTEYLAEAITLADQGVVSVLPQGYFPWVPNPDGTANDVTLVRDQVASMRSALGRLARIRTVDRSRIAVVGHDYGAMYGALLADRDKRVSTLVLEAPDSTWGNWFATFWLGLEGAARDEYLAQFAALDPVHHTSRLGDRVLFQWAGRDDFIPAEVRAEFAASSPEATPLFYERADHMLDDAAQLDRDAFLTEQLGLD